MDADADDPGHPGPEPYRDLVESMRDVVIGFRHDGTITYTNPAGPALLGWPGEDMVGRSIAEFVHPDDLERALEVVGLVLDNPGTWPITPAVYRVRCADGTYLPIEFHSPPNGAASELGDIVTVGRWSGDQPLQREVFETLTSGQPPEAALSLIPGFGSWRHPDERYCLVVEEPDGSRRAYGDPVPALLSGIEDGPRRSPLERARAERQPVRAMLDELPPAVRAVAEAEGLVGCWVVPVDDPMFDAPALLVAWSTVDGPPMQVHRWALVLMEQVLTLVLQWRAQLHALRRAALHDSLTGAANRAHFFEALAARRDGTHTAVLYVDLDGFKPVNDRLGHAAGDQVLIEVTRRIAAVVRPDDLVARLGGDEFAVLCPGVATEDDATDIADRIVSSVAEPMVIGGARVEVGASVGVAITDEDPGEWLLDHADRALYEVKRAGKGAWRLADIS